MLHPVALFGRLMNLVERATYADRRQAGVAYTTTGVAVGVLFGRFIRSTMGAVAGSAAGNMLRSTAHDVERMLERGELDRARAMLPALVGRDPSALDHSGIAAAVVESVAENTVDAVVAPALWGAALGAPGALGYRAVNTMDAMVGHRGDRYGRFGWCSARADDVMNLLPARAAAVLVLGVRPHRAAPILEAIRAQAPLHPSPNAGVAESAFAAALGVRLGGPLRYGIRDEVRPWLGRGVRPETADIGRACVLSSHVELALVTVLAGMGLAAWQSERSKSSTR
jgi:adenosylcobinamide-phosphate synthase